MLLVAAAVSGDVRTGWVVGAVCDELPDGAELTEGGLEAAAGRVWSSVALGWPGLRRKYHPVTPIANSRTSDMMPTPSMSARLRAPARSLRGIAGAEGGTSVVAATTGDSTAINFATPLDKTTPGFLAEMFLGIGFAAGRSTSR